MYIKPYHYRNKFDSHFRHVKKSRNDLNIGRVEYIRDYQREQLDILIECDLRLNTEVNAFIQEDKLIIESFHSTEYSKPFKIHLIKENIFFYNILSSITIFIILFNINLFKQFVKRRKLIFG